MGEAWSVIYEKAIREDGSLLFPERLNHEFLEKTRKVMGSYLFANQYQNEIIPDGSRTFKREWFRYFEQIPPHHLTFCFIDPAVSTADSADYTGLVVVKVDQDGNWFVDAAVHFRLNPTQLVEKIFVVHERFSPSVIGIEDVAFQKALLYMVTEESKRRNVLVPVKGVRPDTTKSKEQKILGLVPLFEYGKIYLRQGLFDLEDELLVFPRGANDDIIDALASLQSIVYAPQPLGPKIIEKPRTPSAASYEQWYLQELKAGRSPREAGTFESEIY